MFYIFSAVEVLSELVQNDVYNEADIEKEKAILLDELEVNFLIMIISRGDDIDNNNSFLWYCFYNIIGALVISQ